MRSFTAVVALSALSVVAAQNSTAFTITLTNVPETTRNNWCIAQENTCGILCNADALGNNCDLSTLNYWCVCQNGTEPGLQYYVNTVDTFVCQEAYSECISNAVGNAKGQANCTSSIQKQCGTLDPADYTPGSSETTTSSTSSASASSTATGTAASSTPTTTTTAGAASVNVQRIGTGAAALALGLIAYML